MTFYITTLMYCMRHIVCISAFRLEQSMPQSQCKRFPLSQCNYMPLGMCNYMPLSQCNYMPLNQCNYAIKSV